MRTIVLISAMLAVVMTLATPPLAVAGAIKIVDSVNGVGIQFPADGSLQVKSATPPTCTTGQILVNNSGSWYCGAVMPVFNGVATCAQSICTISACMQGSGNCDDIVTNGCEAPLTTIQNCGACGNTCTGLQTCVSGTCSGVAKFAFAQQPVNTASASIISPAVTVQVQDVNGNPVSLAGVAISISITTPAGATLSGTVTQVTNASGLAVFSNLSIDKAGSYTLNASVPSLPTQTSSSFNIIPPVSASKLAFVQQPTNSASMTNLSPAVTVEVQDADGNRVTSSSASISIALGTNPTGGSLMGTNTVSAVAGVATFSTLSIDRAGAGYTLSASSGVLIPAASNPFNITVGSTVKLSVSVTPNPIQINTSGNITVSARDAGNNITPATLELSASPAAMGVRLSLQITPLWGATVAHISLVMESP